MRKDRGVASSFSNRSPLKQRLLTVARNSLNRLLDPLTLCVWIAMSCLAALSGPFGTYRSLGFLEFTLIWLVLLGALIALAYVTYEMCRAFLPFLRPRTRQWVFAGIGTVLLSSALHWLLSNWLSAPFEQRPSWLMLCLYVGAIMSCIIVIRRLIPYFDHLDRTEDKDHIGSHLDPEPPSPMKQSRLAARLNLPHGARILSVSASGHFVDVTTCNDIKRIRMRFSDALLELDGTEGIITHRSHWVTHEAVNGWVPHASKPHVILTNGKQIPISKTHFPKVEAAAFDVLPHEEIDNLQS